MAIDAYLKIGDIKGESTDSGHKQWVEISHVSWGVTQPRASTLSTAGGHTNGKADLSEVSFTKLADVASPILFQHCAMGKTIPSATLEFMRADGDGKPVTYFKVELDNVMVSSFHPNSGEGGILTEQVSLAYSRIKLSYTQQKITGGAGGNTSGSWDCAANKVCA